MFGRKYARHQAGKTVSARVLNQSPAAIERLDQSRAGAPLTSQSLPFGQHMGVRAPFDFWVKITGNSGSGLYTWTQQIRGSGGTWSNGPFTDSNSGTAFEVNTTTTVPTNTIVRLRFEEGANQWLFNYGAC